MDLDFRNHVVVSVKKAGVVVPVPVPPVAVSVKKVSTQNYTRPLLSAYIHLGCGTETRIGPSLTQSHSATPDAHSTAFCLHCGQNFPLDQFIWKDTQRKMSS